MDDNLESVDEAVASLRGWAKQAADGGTDSRAERLEAQAKAVEALVAELHALRRKLSPLPSRLGDLSDIPAELRAELSGIEMDELEAQLLAVINAYGGTADLNQILIGLFRKFGSVQKRRFVQQKLWRMTNEEIIWSIPKRKGVYSTTNPASPPLS